ncbi:hypothetical protein OU426_04550 [Frigidibacter sp. RF13]|uniref:hypothetical protein n=1 Tax=Frigidibacter sp. RF13 TaxID=2997340 RepID=UPI002271C68D|nr:hypothetical protein [Frigidibacter sp. RF13]MCY1126116.1 hypothetical protein [Frigidibacter sp. RF13]
MNFHEREYCVYAFFAGLDAPKPWLHSTWLSIVEATSAVFNAARDHGAVRCTQYDLASPNSPAISFGRIGHNARGAAKWTHETDGRLVSGSQARFQSAEVWAPNWNACVRDLLAADAYLCVSNRLAWARAPDSGAIRFPAVCIFAVATDLGEQTRQDGRRAGASLSSILKSPLGFVGVRPWGFASLGGFTDAINDLELVEPFRPPLRSRDDPSLSMLRGNWTPFRDSLS